MLNNCTYKASGKLPCGWNCKQAAIACGRENARIKREVKAAERAARAEALKKQRSSMFVTDSLYINPMEGYGFGKKENLKVQIKNLKEQIKNLKEQIKNLKDQIKNQKNKIKNNFLFIMN